MIMRWYFEFGLKNITHHENRKSIFCLKINTIPIFTYFSQYSKYDVLNQQKSQSVIAKTVFLVLKKQNILDLYWSANLLSGEELAF